MRQRCRHESAVQGHERQPASHTPLVPPSAAAALSWALDLELLPPPPPPRFWPPVAGWGATVDSGSAEAAPGGAPAAGGGLRSVSFSFFVMPRSLRRAQQS